LQREQKQYDFIVFLLRALNFYSSQPTQLHHLSLTPQLSFLAATLLPVPSTFIPRSHTTAAVLLGRREEIVSPKVSGVDFNREIMLGRL
jgi:hypothetical protein